jgi:hypothetical protein
VLRMLGFLGSSNRSLVGEAVKDTQAEGGPPQNL